MFRTLIVNTLISAAAYVVISVFGLVVIPVLIKTYGLTLFGLITLVRLLLPTGLLGVADMGVSETASQAVAKARVSGAWAWAGGQLAWLMTLALCLGAGFVTATLNVSPEHAEDFKGFLRTIGLLSPFLFLGLVAEGVIEQFTLSFAAVLWLQERALPRFSERPNA